MITSVRFLFVMIILFFGSDIHAQKFQGNTYLTDTGVSLSVGDTLQLGKATMGLHYKYLNFKYVGFPSPSVKKRGPASSENEGLVLVIHKIVGKERLIILKGLANYQFECIAIEAFKSGELKFFTQKN